MKEILRAGERPARPHLQSWPRHRSRHAGRKRAGRRAHGARVSPEEVWRKRMAKTGRPAACPRNPRDRRADSRVSAQRGQRAARSAGRCRRDPAPLLAHRPQPAHRDHPGAGTSSSKPNSRRQGTPVPVYVGMRNWRPYIPDVVRQMRADGVEEAAVICMAPQNSRTSVGLYRRAVEAEAGSCASTSPRAGRSIRCLPMPSPSGCAPPWQKLSAEAGAAGSGTVYGAQRAHAHRRSRHRRRPSMPDRVCGRARAPIPTPRRPGTPPSWLPPAFPRFRAGGLPSRARARAADRGSGPPSRKPSTRSPPKA